MTQIVTCRSKRLKNVKPRVRFIGGKLEKLPSDSDDSDYSDLPPLEDYEEDDCEIPPLLDDIDLNALFVESVEEKTKILEDPPAAAPLFPHTVVNCDEAGSKARMDLTRHPIQARITGLFGASLCGRSFRPLLVRNI